MSQKFERCFGLLELATQLSQQFAPTDLNIQTIKSQLSFHVKKENFSV
jgi:hypothetical protein